MILLFPLYQLNITITIKLTILLNLGLFSKGVVESLYRFFPSLRPSLTYNWFLGPVTPAAYCLAWYRNEPMLLSSISLNPSLTQTTSCDGGRSLWWNYEPPPSPHCRSSPYPLPLPLLFFLSHFPTNPHCHFLILRPSLFLILIHP